MILSVGQDERVRRQRRGERLHHAEIRRIARVEEQRGVVAGERSQLALELHVNRLRAGNVARAASAGAVRVERLVHTAMMDGS